MEPSFFLEYRREIALVGRLLLFFAVITLYFYIRPKLKDPPKLNKSKRDTLKWAYLRLQAMFQNDNLTMLLICYPGFPYPKGLKPIHNS